MSVSDADGTILTENSEPMRPASRSSTRRYVKGDKTREQFIQAAKTLFTQRGYHNTSIYDLFELSGISKGAFYHHWKTKEDLALELCAEISAIYAKHFFVLLDSQDAPRVVIDRALHTVAELNAQPNYPHCRLLALFSLEAEPSETRLGQTISELKTRWLAFWHTLIQRAQASGSLRKDLSPEELSVMIVSTLAGLQLFAKELSPESVRHIPDTLGRMLFHASSWSSSSIPSVNPADIAESR